MQPSLQLAIIGACRKRHTHPFHPDRLQKQVYSGTEGLQHACAVKAVSRLLTPFSCVRDETGRRQLALQVTPIAANGVYRLLHDVAEIAAGPCAVHHCTPRSEINHPSMPHTCMTKGLLACTQLFHVQASACTQKQSDTMQLGNAQSHVGKSCGGDG